MMKLSQRIGLSISLSLLLAGSCLAETSGDPVDDLDLAQLEKVLAQGTNYKVVAGDALSKIAVRFYGSSDLWPAIMDVNDEALRGDPNRLQVGMKLKIPALDDAIKVIQALETAPLPGEDEYLASPEGADALTGPADLSSNGGKSAARERGAVRIHTDWVYSEGVARAIRREYMTFESAGRIAYLDPNLKEGARVKKGQTLAYQNQSRNAATVAGANAELANANAQLVSANSRLVTSNSQLTTANSQLTRSKSQVTASQSQVAEANARLVHSNTQLSVAQANRMEAEANLKVAERNFQRYTTLLKQRSASQLEYDNAEAQLTSAKAGVRRATEQINSARADINVAKSGIGTAKSNIATANADVASALANVAAAKSNVAAAKAGVITAKAGVGTAKAGMNSAQVTRKESYLISPINGVVARINVEKGYYYSPQYIQTQTEQQLFNTVPIILIDPSAFEVTIRLPSDQFDSLRVGAEAYIEVVKLNASLEERLPDEARGPQKALPSYKIRGRIHSISPVLDTDLRNFIVTVRTVRGQQFLRDGENVSLWIRRIPKR